MDYAWEKLTKALIYLDGSGSPHERLTYAGLELVISLGPEHFRDERARATWSAIVERLRARAELGPYPDGTIEATVNTMSDDEVERVTEQIRELARLVGVSESDEG